MKTATITRVQLIYAVAHGIRTAQQNGGISAGTADKLRDVAALHPGPIAVGTFGDESENAPKCPATLAGVAENKAQIMPFAVGFDAFIDDLLRKSVYDSCAEVVEVEG